MNRRPTTLATVAVFGLTGLVATAAEFPKFEARTLDPDIGKVCYAVTLADVDGDGKHTIDDGGMATEDLICADLTGDGKLDIVAGGRATKNVKLYIQK